MQPIVCPNCRGQNINRLHRHVWGRLMSLLFRIYPFTCDDCHWKFWARYAPSTHEYLD
jgi:hypothetical protein